jgi:Family of unknown function (DUF5682)
VRAAFVKGELHEDTDPSLVAARKVLVGQARGALPDEAGRPPLIEDFWAEVRAHRLELGDDVREFHCDVERQSKQRARSAFLHRCELLGIPMFGDLPGADGHFVGPDLVEGKELHRLIEKWGVVRGDDLDDVLLELTDRGETILEAAGAVLAERMAGPIDAANAGRCLLTGVVCWLRSLLPSLLAALRTALGTDGSFVNLVQALHDVVVLRRYPDLPAGELDQLVLSAFERACLVLPSSSRVDDDGAAEVVEQIIALSRFAAEDRTLDRRLLSDRLWRVARDAESQPLVRGACWGLLSSLGATTPRAVAGELANSLRGPLAEVRRGGAFLEGVLRTSRSTFLTSERLLEAVHDVLIRLPEQDFLLVLPDFRRAFAVFVPAELERIGEQVVLHLAGFRGEADQGLSVAAAEVARAADRSVQARLAGRAGPTTY